MDVPIIEVELERGESGLGFNIRGGVDQPYNKNDNGIFITKIRDDGAAAVDGRLQLGDKILKINGTSVENVEHDVAVGLFVSAGDKVRLEIHPGAERAIMEMHDNDVFDGSPPTSEHSFNNWATWSIAIGAILTVGLYFGLKSR